VKLVTRLVRRCSRPRRTSLTAAKASVDLSLMVSERDRLEHLDRGPEWATVADNRDHLWHISRFYTKEDRAKGLPARALDIATREGK
jgi:hypothetical protein